MDREEHRALIAAGPTKHIVSRQDLLGLMDTIREAEETCERLTSENQKLRVLSIVSMSVLLWFAALRFFGFL